MPRSEYGPTNSEFAARLKRLILEKAPSIKSAGEQIQAHYPDFFLETLRKYLAPRKIKGEYLPPQVPSWSQLFKIVEVLGIDPADLFAPFDDEPAEET